MMEKCLGGLVKRLTVAEDCPDESSEYRTLEMDIYDSALPCGCGHVLINGHL